ncbi:MAG: hypothetical protein DWQ47_06695 [Acidobacteria bacterium]|nr:MAG: hypothetical protein DWQ32_10245 [Acidobacteriota bacterium]REK02062.1 MAG: hypothetical protein DWQ38_06675 [Acidobacteriota bacterium]REK15020.1 MAG: hypothetical protein DWQ43_15935 [Acidobacteriota bacterium]REK45734.1 MAG: hypothetical protein DWQ47_06695 [Acidobacteriota bacterium]
MNCGNYQNLISAFLDGELDADTWKAVEGHMEACEECSNVFTDFSSILDFCEDSLAVDSEPPNSHALWCRINNIIETEVPEPQEQEVVVSEAAPGFWNSSLNLSAGQIASAVACIAVVSSLVTVIAFQNLASGAEPGSSRDSGRTVFEKVLADLGIGETPVERTERRVKEQRAAIDYWKTKVEARRASWNNETQIVFDRNLSEIDKAVNEYTKLLQEDPQDSISNEMLDSALREKMELLREFSEL